MRNGEKVMKNMKYGILSGIALAAVMLFAACDNIIGTPVNYTKIKDGYGIVSISLINDFIPQGSGRTVMP